MEARNGPPGGHGRKLVLSNQILIVREGQAMVRSFKPKLK